MCIRDSAGPVPALVSTGCESISIGPSAVITIPETLSVLVDVRAKVGIESSVALSCGETGISIPRLRSNSLANRIWSLASEIETTSMSSWVKVEGGSSVDVYKRQQFSEHLGEFLHGVLNAPPATSSSAPPE